jgi:hypothetical protein
MGSTASAGWMKDWSGPVSGGGFSSIDLLFSGPQLGVALSGRVG